MRESLFNEKWQRTGISVLWDVEELSKITILDNIMSINEFFLLYETGWIDELPCSGGNSIIVAGLDNLMDVLEPDKMIDWLEQNLYRAILDFQNEYEGQAALIFWLPQSDKRLKYISSEDTYHWICSNKYKGKYIPISKCLWNGAERDAHNIISNGKNIGLFHPRIS